MVVGQWLRIGYIEGSPADPPRPKGVNQRVGDYVSASPDVYQPRPRCHEGQLGRADDRYRRRRKGQRNHHQRGGGQCGVECFRADLARVSQKLARTRPAAQHRDLTAKRFQQPKQRFGDSAATETQHVGAEEACAQFLAPASRLGVAADVAHSRQRQRHDMFGHRFGVNPLAACPDAAVVEEPLRHPIFDSCER